MFNFFRNIVNKRLLVAFLMGIVAGLPLLITITLMHAWAKDAGVSLKKIGLMALVGLPYTVKFLWAPYFDRFTLPFLGRRRGHLLVVQILLALVIAGMGFTDPSINLTTFIIVSAIIAFFSASQDIVIDAYRREDLMDHELGIGSSYYVYGYRIGMLIVSSGGLILADQVSWKIVHIVMALFMLIGIVTTFFCAEPKVTETQPTNFKESVILPFIEFFNRPSATWILLFILLYKVGDNMAGTLSTPFYLDIGFTKTEIGTIAKLFGFWATMGGLFVGGTIILKMGINKSLWIFGFLQMISTAAFSFLAYVGHSIPVLAGVITFENLSSGMGTAAFTAFMASMTSKKFTATQYALLTSIMGIPRVFISSGTGFIAEPLGWVAFFLICTLVAIPGMLMLFKFAPWNKNFFVEDQK